MSNDPERAYIEVRKRLQGHFERTSNLRNWPKIGSNDAKSIQEFSDFLQQFELATKHVPNLEIFEHSSKFQSGGLAKGK